MMDHILLRLLLICFAVFATDCAPEIKPQVSQVYNCQKAVKNYDCIFKNVVYKTEADAGKGTYMSKTFKETSIAFRESTLLTFPRIADKFPALAYLAVDGSGIKSFPTDAFKNAKKLVEIYLHDNDVPIIKDRAFLGAKNLQVLSMYKSGIKTIEDNALLGLTELDELYLDSNLIEKLSSRTFANTQDLQILELQENKIKIINDDQFIDNTKLRELNVSRNAITKFNMVQLVKLVKIDVLDVSFNALDYVFIPKYVNIFNASNNQIKTIQVDEGTKFELEELNLSHNQISELTNLAKIGSIKNLDLSHNEISKLDLVVFSTMTKLKTLKLDHNNLWELDNSMTKADHDLSLLDLSHNKLTFVDMELLSTFPKLETIVLKGNGLIEIVTEDVIKRFSKLTVLSIEDNEIDCPQLSKIVGKFDNKVKFFEGNPSCEKGKDNVKSVCCTKTENVVKKKLVETIKETKVLKKTVIKLKEDNSKLENHNNEFYLNLEEKLKNPLIALSTPAKAGDKVSKLKDYLKFLEQDSKTCNEKMGKFDAEKENMQNSMKKVSTDNETLQKQVKELMQMLERDKQDLRTLKEEIDRLKVQVKTLQDPKNKVKYGAIVQ